MTGVIVCHGSAAVRDRIVAAAHGVPALVPARSAATVEELIVLARRAVPALVLLDAHLPGAGPIEALRRLRMLGVQSAVIMLAVPGDEITLDRAIPLGARGYLPPDVDRNELAAVAAHSLASTIVAHPQVPAPRTSLASNGAVNGQPYGALGNGHPSGSHATNGQAAGQPAYGHTNGHLTPVAGEGAPHRPAIATDLTRRELEVLAGMSHGRSNAQIGAELFLSEDTVKTHARRLFRKLGAADRAQAVAIGLRAGLIR